MGAYVGIDAKVEWSANGTSGWTQFSERNEFSISINVDTAEHRIFVATLADAWSDKARTWMSWSGSLNGYYDDANDDIFDKVVAGNEIYLRFTTSQRSTGKVWQGKVILTSVEHGVGTDDYATLSVDFEGIGALTRVVVP